MKTRTADRKGTETGQERDTTMTQAETREKAADLAAKILPADRIAPFIALPVKDQVIGIAALAHIGGDPEMRDAALAILGAS